MQEDESGAVGRLPEEMELGIGRVAELEVPHGKLNQRIPARVDPAVDEPEHIGLAPRAMRHRATHWGRRAAGAAR